MGMEKTALALIFLRNSPVIGDENMPNGPLWRPCRGLEHAPIWRRMPGQSSAVGSGV